MKKLGVISQVKRAARKGNRLATAFGAAFGGYVPVSIYNTAHSSGFDWTGRSAILVYAGLVFSALTVYQWARSAFGNEMKAAGFCVLLEGTMSTTDIHWLALTSLAYLIAINAVAAGCNLSLGVKSK